MSQSLRILEELEKLTPDRLHDALYATPLIKLKPILLAKAERFAAERNADPVFVLENFIAASLGVAENADANAADRLQDVMNRNFPGNDESESLVKIRRVLEDVPTLEKDPLAPMAVETEERPLKQETNIKNEKTPLLSKQDKKNMKMEQKIKPDNKHFKNDFSSSSSSSSSCSSSNLFSNPYYSMKEEKKPFPYINAEDATRQLKSDITNIHQRLSEMDAFYTQHTGIIHELQQGAKYENERLQAMNSAIENLKGVLSKDDARINEANDKLDESNASFQAFTHKLTATFKERDDKAKSESDDLLGKLDVFESQINRDITEHNKSINEQKIHLNNLENTLSVNEPKMEELERKIQSVLNELKQIRGDVAGVKNLKGDIAGLNGELLDVLVTLKTVQTKHDELQNTLQLYKQQLDTAIGNFTSRMNEQDDKLENLNQSLQQLRLEQRNAKQETTAEQSQKMQQLEQRLSEEEDSKLKAQENTDRQQDLRLHHLETLIDNLQSKMNQMSEAKSEVVRELAAELEVVKQNQKQEETRIVRAENSLVTLNDTTEQQIALLGANVVAANQELKDVVVNRVGDLIQQGRRELIKHNARRALDSLQRTLPPAQLPALPPAESSSSSSSSSAPVPAPIPDSELPVEKRRVSMEFVRWLQTGM
jgi:chromosome segregation ATPase